MTRQDIATINKWEVKFKNGRACIYLNTVKKKEIQADNWADMATSFMNNYEEQQLND